MEDSRSTKRCVAFPYCGDCKCGQPEESIPNISLQIGEFFDVLINDNYRKDMRKYINMAALRDDFITETIKVIDEAKNISDFDKRWQCVVAYTYKIPFEFSRVTDGDISGEISDFILNFTS